MRSQLEEIMTRRRQLEEIMTRRRQLEEIMTRRRQLEEVMTRRRQNVRSYYQEKIVRRREVLNRRRLNVRSYDQEKTGHRATPEPNGRLRIVIKKTRPLLGIAIEGGVNTGQPLPRIISIHTSGAAFEAGGLKVGHIILEVNGFKTGKLKHNEVAQLIADSFYSSDTDQLELLVVERARTELELRRSSFLVLE
ncbi:uncharacterized protein LOC143227937 [Tachypleus tridentatus]|uniref:uncharacterized protein LOC143227937 n=1 Tax=Tachypleus tridentatus TaxID=6853 RepID=UPI003FD08D64